MIGKSDLAYTIFHILVYQCIVLTTEKLQIDLSYDDVKNAEKMLREI